VIRFRDANFRRIVVPLGLGALAGAAIYVAAVAPLRSLYERGQETLQERLELARRLANSAAELPRLREAAAKWRGVTHDQDLLFAGSSDAVAGATLQSALKDLIEEGGATLTSAEILPSEASGKFAPVAVRVSFSGNLALIAAVLRGIEESRPVILVDRLDIRSGNESGGEGDDPSFAIALDVHGYRAL
jgi:hypothetical protein